MEKHFVRFYCPGTIVSETVVQEIDSWDVEAAMDMARDVKVRHAAVPYAFRFETRARSEEELDSKIINHSQTYHLGGKVETLAEIEARNDPEERILLGNMRSNGYEKIIVNTNSWKWVSVLKPGDIVLDFKM